jgi:uncharacterized protein YdeI (YjbR/CyaY-like superfamily)
MPTKDKRIDAYIAKSADFAKPILIRLREIVHESCPDCEETLKWGHPTFMYGGAILCGMVAFKQRCGLHFWKGALINPNRAQDAQWAKLEQLVRISDIPPKKTLAGYIKAGMALNDAGINVPKAPVKAKKDLIVPDAFMAAMKKSKKALATFDAFSPSHKREYVEWITDAKGEDTRARRIAQAVEWMAEGKPRNWKYMPSL